MAEENKIIRLADVGELEADLKKDLAEEEAKGRAADVLYCESISDELSDLGNLPTIDPKTLRPVAHWEEIPGSYEVCAGESGYDLEVLREYDKKREAGSDGKT